MTQRGIRVHRIASLVLFAVFALANEAALAQHSTGFTITKTCPVSVAGGAAFQCTFSVVNMDVDHGIVNLAVTNTVPYPGGTTTSVSCQQTGSPVTTLGPHNSLTGSCAGTIDEQAPAAGSTTIFYVDRVDATGEDAGVPGLSVTGFAQNAVQIPPHITGVAMTKTCPVSVSSFQAFQCTFTIENQDTQHGIANLAVTNQAPFPGGPVTAVSCLHGGVAVTSLGVYGTATDSCAGVADENAPLNSSTQPTPYVDQIAMTGEDAGVPGLSVSGSVSGVTFVQPLSVMGSTPPGSDVPQTLGNVTIVYSTVTEEGETTVTAIDPAEAGALPGGYTIPDVGFAYEISTTATLSGDITIGFVVPDDVDLVTFNGLRVLHSEGGVLVDRTYFSPDGCTAAPGEPCPAPDFATKTVYARVSSLSPFVLALTASPSVGPITVPGDPTPLGTAVNVEAGFTDPGTGHTAIWSWGDGTTSAGVVTEAGDGTGTVTGSHVYTAAGVYQVTLTVTDAGGASGQRVSPYVVVYDPDGGFVSGSGWIASPAGAYAADEDLAGKATFGFVSRYQRHSTAPTGSTEFQFQAADFRFESDSYEWLVISGSKARYRGVGQVNGEGSYGFELYAWDGGADGADRFRIRIWDRNQGNAVVYDNEMNASGDADPTTVLGGGSILIHKK